MQGMPTDLAFRTGARLAIFEFLEKERGEGWWGSNEMSTYYADHERGANPFNWISGHPLMDAEIISQYSFDHAAKGETSLMMALCPESVDMSHLSTEKWYLETARDATLEYGQFGADLVLERMRKILTKQAASVMARQQGSRTWFFPDGDIPPAGRPAAGPRIAHHAQPRRHRRRGRPSRSTSRTASRRSWRRSSWVPGGCAASAPTSPSAATRSPSASTPCKLESSAPIICQIGRMDVAAQPRLLHRDGPCGRLTSRSAGHPSGEGARTVSARTRRMRRLARA